MLSDWPAEDVEDLTRLMGRLAETVHSKLDALPARAMAEFCRVSPDAVPEAASVP